MALSAQDPRRNLIDQVQPLISKTTTPGVAGYSAPQPIEQPPAAQPGAAPPKPPAGGTPTTPGAAPAAPVPGMAGGATTAAPMYPIQQQAQAMISQVRPTTRSVTGGAPLAPAAPATAPPGATDQGGGNVAPTSIPVPTREEQHKNQQVQGWVVDPVTGQAVPASQANQVLGQQNQTATMGSFGYGNPNQRFTQTRGPDGQLSYNVQPGYAQLTDRTGAHYFVNQSNAAAIQAAMDSNNQNEFDRLMALDTAQNPSNNSYARGGVVPPSVQQQAQTVVSAGGGRPILGGDAVVDPGSTTGQSPRPTTPPADVGGTNQGSGSSSSRGIPPGAGPSAATNLGGSGSANEDRRTFGPGDDLRFSVIDPGTFSPSSESQRARGLTMGALENAMTGPDRGQIAQDRYGLLLGDLKREEARSTRELGQKGAAWGIMGSGMMTTDLADMGTEFQRLRVRGAQELGLDTADREVADRIARANLGANVGSMWGNEDLDQAGFLQSQRNELRGERGYQYGVGRDVVADKESDARLSEYMKNSSFSRKMQLLDMISRADASADPVAALQAYEASLREQGDHQTANEIAANIARRRAGGR